MSKPIRYDPPLVRALAAELQSRLSGRGAHPVPLFDRDRSATLLLDRGEALRWDLHPQRGWLTLGPRPAGLENRLAEARITRVSAPPDERLLRIDLVEGGRFRGSERALVFELHTNQWNAVLVDRASRQILSVLRAREAAERVLRPGERYDPPRAQERRGGADREALRQAWLAELSPLAPDERAAALMAGWADASPLNAASILATDLEDAFERWWRVHTLASAHPVLLGASQPYPVPLPGLAGTPTDSLLEAFAQVAAAAMQDEPEQDHAHRLAATLRRVAQLERRVGSLRTQAEQAGGGDRVRALGDLLLANLDRVPHGADRVTLPGFDGGEVEIALDPELRPHQNADALYEKARRMTRAEQQLPALIDRAERELERWRQAAEVLRTGEVPAWLPAALARASKPAKGAAAPRLPYRVYTTSGGLEVRVGRGRADNDRLTFRHCTPDDVWLHARQVPGSHVVLRWTHADAPPARDLEEAAALAAWHSRARTSATVAVDWTRRRYVRKPRNAPPGRVSVIRAKTIFVEPAGREERGSG